MRLIDADELKKKKKHSYKEFFENVVSVYDIDNAPTVETERKKGKWHQRFYQHVEMKVCSECQEEFSHDAETGISDYNFCPNCVSAMTV